MSKLANFLSFNVQWPTKIIIKPPLFKHVFVNFSSETTNSTHYERLIKYDLTTIFRAEAFLPEFKSSEDPNVIYDLKRAIIEEVFGEFRPLINELKIASYEYDIEKIQKLLAALEYKMFEEGVKDFDETKSE